MTNKISGCCGSSEQTDAPFNSDGGFCADCREHCEYIAFEDAAGNETPMFVDANGMLSETPMQTPYTPYAQPSTPILQETPEPYAQRGGKVTLGEVLIVAWIPIALFFGAMALQIAGY